MPQEFVLSGLETIVNILLKTANNLGASEFMAHVGDIQPLY